MIRSLGLQEVKQVTGGELSGMNASFQSVSIDTRTLQENELFVAITGPNFNGNDFVADAIKQKAVAAIVSEEVESSIPTLTVKDTRIALGQIGAMNRQRSSACVIALTGSQGKTTVKEMVAAILSSCGEVQYTKGNLNNDYGVPLSLLSIGDEHQYAVIEMGASGAGEIAYCVELTRPEIAHITNVSATHIEGFGDIEGVAKAKGEIWNGIVKGGIAVINIDDEFSESWCELLTNKEAVSRVSISAEGNTQAQYYLSDFHFKDNLTSNFNLHTPKGSCELVVNLAGKHNAANALAAAALSMEAGASLRDIKAGLAKVKPVKGRLSSQQGPNGSLIIDDSYNASPSSFRAAIDVLSELPGETILVCGDMGEMGSEAQLAHQELGLYAKAKSIRNFFATGTYSHLAAESFGETGVYCSDQKSLAQKIMPLLNENSIVLVKGSRSAGMEKLIQLLMAEED